MDDQTQGSDAVFSLLEVFNCLAVDPPFGSGLVITGSNLSIIFRIKTGNGTDFYEKIVWGNSDGTPKAYLNS